MMLYLQSEGRRCMRHFGAEVIRQDDGFKAQLLAQPFASDLVV